jgi:hypothetical protein
VRIARARPRIWKLALALDGVVVAQNRHPDPPVADFAALEFTLQWSQLMQFKVAADLTIQRPALHLNLAQIQEEATNHVSLKDQGWQAAVEAIYPFKLDQVRIQDGSTGVDVADGLFSVYTELTVKGGRVEGYFLFHAILPGFLEEGKDVKPPPAKGPNG